MTDTPTPPGPGSAGREQYDDSFVLGPVPGGDVLYQPPQQVGDDGVGRATPPTAERGAARTPPAVSVEGPPQSWPYGRPGEQVPHYQPLPPPPARPAEWGPSRVNIPSSAGPPPSPPGGWVPSRGHRKKVPVWLLVIGGLWFGSQAVGFIGSAISSFTNGATTSSGTYSSSAATARQIDGMSLTDVPVLATRNEIVWRIENPPQDMRTYTIWHDGAMVRTIEGTGTVRIIEPYAPGLWSVSFPGYGEVRCGVFVDAVLIATLTNPGSPDASCFIDTAWLPAQ